MGGKAVSLFPVGLYCAEWLHITVCVYLDLQDSHRAVPGGAGGEGETEGEGQEDCSVCVWQQHFT